MFHPHPPLPTTRLLMLEEILVEEEGPSKATKLKKSNLSSERRWICITNIFCRGNRKPHSQGSYSTSHDKICPRGVANPEDGYVFAVAYG